MDEDSQMSTCQVPAKKWALPKRVSLFLSWVPAYSVTQSTLWTVCHQAPLSMRFFKQAYWSGLPFPPPGYLPSPGIELKSPASPALQAGSLAIGEAPYYHDSLKIQKSPDSVGLPWWSSDWDSVLPMQGARVQPLIRELDPTRLN